MPHRPGRAAWLVPGIGCRYVGMGHDLFGHFECAQLLFDQARSVLGYDLSEVCLTGSGRKHVPPRQESQVIYVLDCAYAAVLREHGHAPLVVAGHSLGSLAAGWICGAYDFLSGLRLVTLIEELMEDLIDGRGQAMAVTIGLDRESLQTQLEVHPNVHLANWNSPLQYVVGGPAADVDRFVTAALARGAKQARRFGFERAIHTPCVTNVARQFSERLQHIDWTEPATPMAVSTDGLHVHWLQTAGQIQHFLSCFLSQPVYWQATVEGILGLSDLVLREEMGPVGRIGSIRAGDFIEVGPGNVLSGMLPFINRAAGISTASEILDQKAAK